MATIPSKKLDSARILEKAVDVATFYGFRPYAEALKQEKTLKKVRTVCVQVDKVRTIDSLKKQSSVIETYVKYDAVRKDEPKLLYFFTLPRSTTKESTPYGRFNLEIFGLQRSIAEATIIRTCLSILEEIGQTNMHVGINSTGDRESLARFYREYSTYYRRRVMELHTPCRENFRKNFSKMFSCQSERCVTIRSEAPQTIAYLSEPSRQHFKEILETLETIGVPYEIDNNLVRDTDKFCETVFEIRRTLQVVDPQNKALYETLAYGGRYNYLARQVGSKKDVPAVGMTIALQTSPDPEKSLHRSRKKPKVYFIRLGHEATKKSFSVLETLRKTRIPLLQSHGADKLMGQLGIAEKLTIPYTMIMGQREAVDGTVIFRNTATRVQETIPVERLAQHLQGLL